MKIEQLIYGYRDGHRLLASSNVLQDSLAWELLRATDRPSVSLQELSEGITFGFPLSEQYYALCRTWNAKEIKRPGAVWTHVLLLPTEMASPLEYANLLHTTTTPDIEKFKTPILTKQNKSAKKPHLLTAEAAHLLMMIAAKPQSGFYAHSLFSSLEVLINAQENWKGIIGWQPFSTSAGKKDILANKKALVLTSEIFENNSFGRSSPSLIQMKIPSKRITKSWDKLAHEPFNLHNWLYKIGRNFYQRPTNLKLVMESLLLGDRELDDNKLLIRINDAFIENSSDDIFKYLLGKPFGDLATPHPWVSALFLLGKHDWDKWDKFVEADEVGSIAAGAPTINLADRLNDLSTGPDVESALISLSNTISASNFELLNEQSENAAGVLIQRNPELIYSLPQAKQQIEKRRSGRQFSQADPKLAIEFDIYSWAPFLWKSIVGSKIRFSYSNGALIKFAVCNINDGTWERLSDDVKGFLLQTPNFLKGLLNSSTSKKVLKIALQEFDSLRVERVVIDIIQKKQPQLNEIAEGLVEYFGSAEKLASLLDESNHLKENFVALVAEARWRDSHSKKVLSRIENDLSKQANIKTVIKNINDKTLLKELESSLLIQNIKI